MKYWSVLSSYISLVKSPKLSYFVLLVNAFIIEWEKNSCWSHADKGSTRYINKIPPTLSSSTDPHRLPFRYTKSQGEIAFWKKGKNSILQWVLLTINQQLPRRNRLIDFHWFALITSSNSLKILVTLLSFFLLIIISSGPKHQIYTSTRWASLYLISSIRAALLILWELHLV